MNTVNETQQLINETTEATVDFIAKTVQEKLGVAYGDVAGVFFSDDAVMDTLSSLIADYVRTEQLYQDAPQTSFNAPTP